jgi:hypothetical protein
VGEAGDPAYEDLLRVARASARPGLVVATGRPAGGGADPTADEPVPLLAGRGLVDGRAAAYVCRGMVCDRPVTGAEELRALL